MLRTWKIYIDAGRHCDDELSAKQMGRNTMSMDVDDWKDIGIPIWFCHGARGYVWLDWLGTGTCGVGTARILNICCRETI
jgi:hypothetical protein